MKTQILIKWFRFQKWCKQTRHKVMAQFGRIYQVTLVYGQPKKDSVVVYPPITYWTKIAPDLPEIGSKHPKGMGYLMEWRVDSI